MTTVLEPNDNASAAVLYMVLELSHKRWKLGFSDGARHRQVSIEAGDWLALDAQMRQAKAKLNLAADARVVSCYEAGRDGFWIHRALRAQGIENVVVDSSSIEVNRRKRRAKTDRLDAKSLLGLLQRHWGKERGVLRVLRVPTLEEEDRRRLHRERERLLKERGAHSARIKSLLVTQGVRLTLRRDFLGALQRVTSAAGHALGADLQAELAREYARYQLVDEQIKALEAEQSRRAEQNNSEALNKINRLLLLKGVGRQSSWALVMEFFAWRAFKNRRELGACAGLTPTPYSSGDRHREQGISKAGNRRIRSLMVELSWLWLRYQRKSALSQWYGERFAQGGARMRRIGIVAMARKLLIALWRYVSEGLIPAGAVLKT